MQRGGGGRGLSQRTGKDPVVQGFGSVRDWNAQKQGQVRYKQGGGEITEDNDVKGISIVVKMWTAGFRSMIVSLPVEKVVNVIWIPWMMSTCW